MLALPLLDQAHDPLLGRLGLLLGGQGTLHFFEASKLGRPASAGDVEPLATKMVA
jgi:hypothetical protein